MISKVVAALPVALERDRQPGHRDRGRGFPGAPPTPPSMRIRTRRFVSFEQARSISLLDRISLVVAASCWTFPSAGPTFALNARRLCGSSQSRVHLRVQCRVVSAFGLGCVVAPSLPATRADSSPKPFIQVARYARALLQHKVINPTARTVATQTAGAARRSHHYGE